MSESARDVMNVPPPDTSSEDSAAQPASLREVNEKLVQQLLRAQAEVEDSLETSREVARLAGLDALTGLPTRTLLIDRFEQAAALADRHRGRLAFLFVDLDNFKQINDGSGHAAGDDALKNAAACLQQAVRAADTVSRHGGDEFLILLTDVVHASDAAHIATKMIAALSDIRIDPADAAGLSASIGISLYPDHGTDAQALIEHADAAMYSAKQAGRGAFRFHGEVARLGLREIAAGTRMAHADADSGELEQARQRLNSELRDSNEELLLAALREIEQRTAAENSLQIALDAADMGSWELDLRTGEARRSLRHDQIFGHASALPRWSLAAALGQFLPEDRAAVGAAFDEARASGQLEFERRIRRESDGSVRWLHVKGQTFFENGEPVRIAGVVADVTDRITFEDQSRQAQKMEAVGRLTGGVAHDFNNLLLVIGGSLELLARRPSSDERSARLIEAARRGVANGAALTQQLLAFSRRQDLKPEQVSVGHLMPVFAHLLGHAASEAIEIVVACGEEPWPCFIDPHQLEVAVLNLAINARDVMPFGGVMTLRAQNRVVEQSFASRWGAVGGEFVSVALGDTGPGMPDAIVARAFEPFFTTKPVGQGTGLGLSQVYGFAKQSGGFVSIERGETSGTTVTMFLPRSDAATASAVSPALAMPPLRHGHGVVLVVEDNAEVRAVASAMLSDLGYDVLEAATADACLAVVATGTPVDLIFSDLIMPGASGIDLAVELRRRWPRLPVLLTSGYTAQQTIPTELAGRLGLLHKPYSQAELASALQDVFAAAPPSP